MTLPQIWEAAMSKLYTTIVGVLGLVLLISCNKEEYYQKEYLTPYNKSLSDVRASDKINHEGVDLINSAQENNPSIITPDSTPVVSATPAPVNLNIS